MTNTIEIADQAEFKEFIEQYFIDRLNHINDLRIDGEDETAASQLDDLNREYQAIINEKDYSPEYESIQMWIQDYCVKA